MNCTKCGGKTQVIDSRDRRGGDIWYRRRRCTICKYTFATHEIPCASTIEGETLGSAAEAARLAAAALENIAKAHEQLERLAPIVEEPRRDPLQPGRFKAKKKPAWTVV